MSKKNNRRLHCRNCGEPLSVTWHLPGSCKRCGASFQVRPPWMPSVVLMGAVVVAIVVGVLVQLVSKTPAVAMVCALCVGVVAFSALGVGLFKLGVLKLTHVNTKAGYDGDVIHPQDPSGLAKAEDSARAKMYTGTDRHTLETQAQQLKETMDMVSSLRNSEADAQRTEHQAADRRAAPARTHARCRLRRLQATNEAGIRRMSALATSIVREYFDAIVGEEQNDYMIARFLSPEAITAQIEQGYDYCFVFPPKADEEEANCELAPVRPVGLVAAQQREGHELHIGKLFLLKDERGKGYGRSVMRMMVNRARKLDCDHIQLHVNRNNYQAMLAFEHMGFVRTGERRADIGNGYTMDDYTYELSIPPRA